MRELVRDLALALRERVLPQLGSHAGRAHAGRRAGGDVTFAIDADAEALLEAVPRRARARRRLLLGGPRPGRAGRRRGAHGAGRRPDRRHAAGAGRARVVLRVGRGGAADGEPTMGDVTVGCVVEIPSGRVFLAERGAGLVEGPPVRLSRNERLDRMFWTFGFRGRPARAAGGGARRPDRRLVGRRRDASSSARRPST